MYTSLFYLLGQVSIICLIYFTTYTKVLVLVDELILNIFEIMLRNIRTDILCYTSGLSRIMISCRGMDYPILITFNICEDNTNSFWL